MKISCHKPVYDMTSETLDWVDPHVKVFFLIIKDMFIIHCLVAALKGMFLLSSAQQGSDSVFTFTTLLSTKPLTYGKFTNDL